MADENKFLHLGNSNDKILYEKFKGKLEKKDIATNNKLLQIFNFFDKDGNGIIETANSKGVNEMQSLWNAVRTSATKNSNSIFEDSEAQEFLANSVDSTGKSLADNQVTASDLFAFLKALITPQSKQANGVKLEDLKPEDIVEYTPEEIEDISIQTVTDGVRQAREVFDAQKAQQGAVSDFVNETKETFDTEYASSRVDRYLMNEELCAQLLQRAKEDGLSEKEYLEAKIDLAMKLIQSLEKYSLRTEVTQDAINISLSFLTLGIADKKETKNSRELKAQKLELENLKTLLAKLSPEEINMLISQLLFIEENPKGNSNFDFSFGGKNNKAKPQTVTRYGVEGEYLHISPEEYEGEAAPNSLESLSKPYAIYKKMTFEEVFEKERGVQYNPEAIMDYSTKEAQLQFLVGMHNRNEAIKNILHDATVAVDGNNKYGAPQHDAIETCNQNLATRTEGVEVMNNIKIGDKSIAEIMNEIGVDGNPEELLNLLNNEETIVTYDNFVGTSLLTREQRFPDAGKNGNNDNVALFWDITVPKGSKGAFIENLTSENIMSEMEFLLQAGSQIKITGAEFKDGIWHLKGELVGVKNSNISDVSSNIPKGLTSEEDALIQQARTENPADVVADKVKQQWMEDGLHTSVEDEPVDLFNLDPNAGLRQPAPEVNGEVTSLIFTGKLKEVLTQRYDEMSRVFNDIAQKRSADFKKLAQECGNDKQAFANGVIAILAEEMGMKGLEPKIELINTEGKADGLADWTTGTIQINEYTSNAKKLVEIISHEFAHMLQYRDVLAQYGEQGLREIIMNDKSIPANQKEATIRKVLDSDYTKNLLDNFNELQHSETGSLNEYITRIYKDEFANPVDPDVDMQGYVDQVTEREAYNLGSERLGNNTQELDQFELNDDWTREQGFTIHESSNGVKFKVYDDGTIERINSNAPKGIISDISSRVSNLFGNKSVDLNKYRRDPNFSLRAKRVEVTEAQLNKIYNEVYNTYRLEGYNKEYAKSTAQDYIHELKNHLNGNSSVREHYAWMVEHPELFGNITKRNINDGWNEYFSKDQHATAWKMHLFADTEMDWRTMSEVVIPYLKEHGVNWKTVDEALGVTELHGSQTGKAFTIYPKSNEEMAKIAQDLDYIIRNNNLERTDSNIEGDRQLGTTGRLFYRYEWDSGRYKDEVLDLSKQSDSNTCSSRYDENRGIDPITGESRYLANDMTPADDIWLNFDPSVGHPKANQNTPNSQVNTVKLQANQRYEINEFPILKLADYELDLNQPRIRQALESLVEGQRITVGREGNIKISADNPRISRQHVIIEKRNGKLYIIDNNSTNGTSIITRSSQSTPKNQQYSLKTIVDETLDRTPQAIIEKRFSIRSYLEKNFPNEFNKIMNKVGNNYAFKIKWEEIINNNSTLEQDRALLNEIYRSL